MERNQYDNFCVLCFRKTGAHQKIEPLNKLSSDFPESLGEESCVPSHDDNVLEGNYLCSRCKPIISFAHTSKLEVEETERNVRQRQEELLWELRRLEEQIGAFKIWMLSVDHVVQVSKSGSFEMILGDREGSDDLLQIREKVLNVIDDLQVFHKLVSSFSIPVVGEENDSSSWTTPVSSESPSDHSGRIPKSELHQNYSPSNVEETEIKTEVDSGDEAMYNYLANYHCNEHYEDPTEKEPQPEKRDFSSPVTSKPCKSNTKNTGNRNLKKCDICGKLIKRHHFIFHKRIHTGEKPYQCQFCDKRFTQWVQMSNHWKRVHPDRKPYACGLCDARYFEKAELRSHVKDVHGVTAISRVDNDIKRCEVCDKSVKRTEYSRHLDGHRNRKEKSVRFRAGNLDAAEETESSDRRIERRFQCDFCEREFCTKAELISHRRRHTGETPFACDLCDGKFSYRNTLIYHRKKVHGVDPPPRKYAKHK